MSKKTQQSPVGISMTERGRRRLEARVRLAYQKERAASAAGRSKLALRYRKRAQDWARVLEAYRERSRAAQAEALAHHIEREMAREAGRAAKREEARRRMAARWAAKRGTP